MSSDDEIKIFFTCKLNFISFNSFLHETYKYNLKPIKLHLILISQWWKLKKEVNSLEISLSNFGKTGFIYFLPSIRSSERISNFGRVVSRCWFNNWTRAYLNIGCFTGRRSFMDVFSLNCMLLLIEESKL